MLTTVARKSLFYDLLDRRIRHWSLIGDPLFPLVVCGGYLLFTYIIGPRLMKDRKPFDLRWAIRLHNLFMVLANAYFLLEFGKVYWNSGYNLLCQGITYATDPNTMRMLSLGWWYLIVRSLDFFDTFFFVLRKKYDHVTFQHVSHHFCCVFSGHIFLSYGMDGQPWLGLTINLAIHVVMYAYYFLATLGPSMKPYLWWKKYLTTAQIVQHIVVIFHGLIPIIVYDCGYPRGYFFIAFPQGILGLILFVNFYAVAYTGKKSWADIFSGTPCVLSDDNDPTKFQRLLKSAAKDKCSKSEASDANGYDAALKSEADAKPLKSD